METSMLMSGRGIARHGARYASVALLAGATLAGCASEPKWNKAEVTEQQIASDVKACTRTVRTYYFLSGSRFYVDGEQVDSECMEIRGYRKDKDPTTARNLIDRLL